MRERPADPARVRDGVMTAVAAVSQLHDLAREMAEARVCLASASAVMVAAHQAIQDGQPDVAASELREWLRMFRPGSVAS